MTLEEALQENLRLEGELAKANQSIENYSKQVSELSTDLEKVRDINQQYFLEIQRQYKPAEPDGDEDEKDVPTCEEFAQTLTI